MAVRVCVVAALLGVVAGCSAEPSIEALDLDTAAAGEAIVELTAGVEEYEEFEECAFDPRGSLLLEALDEVDTSDASRAATADASTAISFFEDDLGRSDSYLACNRLDQDDSTSAGIVVSVAPDDFDRYVELLIGDTTGERVVIERTEGSEHRGGRLERLCVDYSDDDPWCEVNWLNDEIHVTFYLQGSSTQSSDVADIELGLLRVLDRVIANLDAA